MKHVFKSKKYKEVDSFLNAFLFGLGRILQEIMDIRSGFSMLRSVGYSMIEYLEKENIHIEKNSPYQTILTILKSYADGGLVQKIEVWKDDNKIHIVLQKPFDFLALAGMCKRYGKRTHLIPSPLFSLIHAVLLKMNYEIRIYKEEFDMSRKTFYYTIGFEKFEIEKILK